MAARFLDELKSLIKKRGGFAKPSHFEVNFSGLEKIGFRPEDARDLSALVTRVNIPERRLKTVEFSPFRHMTLYPIGYENETLSIEFNVPTDMFVKKIFDTWSEKILPTDSYLMKYASSGYKIDLEIFQKAEGAVEKTLDHKVMYMIKLNDVFPVLVPKIEMSDDAEGILKVTVEFAYDDIKWEILETNPNKIINENDIRRAEQFRITS
jgi:hypothetical protein